MNDTQKLIEAIQKIKVRLSWLPFWYAGFFFTIGYNWAEASEIAAQCSLWQNVLNGGLWFLLWPWFLGYTLGR